MSKLHLHCLIAAAGGLVLPLIAGDTPDTAAPIEHSVSFAVRGPASEPDRPYGLHRSAATGSFVSDKETDK